ncbi:Adhesion G protein-coupled receptor A1 [Goodea atripinnis]|uniref:Adhesion G protein-coupled receptor A1 n=1 Tax=Goodea atripinnis TaxID=208336 RepID=A0ABV0NEY2_9TELE
MHASFSPQAYRVGEELFDWLSQVGFVLHYSSLSTMLWLGVTARNIYKQVTKKSPQSLDGDPPSPPKQPLLR